jgi:hypothetical protein
MNTDTETVRARDIRAGDYVRDRHTDDWTRIWCVEQYGPGVVCTDQSADTIRQIEYGDTIERIPAKEVDDE